MGQEIKLIRKQFRITRQEEKQIKEMMREQICLLVYFGKAMSDQYLNRL
ncbi:TPA: hypothetical protein U0J94_001996 [Streptococcus suis]|nr:hypothetical protein [Streptococcus suis]HEL2343178.1 hypothetical protein [Streptococcus suis]HEL9624541.1 hypothetical protein [Streptococcus suis]HEM3885552.1 hypothetical protein [Streptococcus suis]